METISNVVNTATTAATKAIWGDQPAAGNETAGNEPVSGIQGKGTATEPYDQGNAADPTDPSTRNETAGKEPVSGFQGKGTTTEPFDQGNAADAADPTGKTEAVGKTETSLPIREKSSSTPADDLTAKPTAPAADAFNSAAAANASTLGQTSAITSQVDGAETTATDIKPLDTTENIGSSATGIKPLDTTEKTDSPVTGIKPLDSTAAASGPETVAVKSEKLGASDVLSKPDDSSKATEVKSTGLGADGGNFDASKPGAGKEADRLLEEKGITKDDKGAFQKKDASPTGGKEKEVSPTGGKEKVSKVEKLKEKLHIGHKH